MVMPRNPDCFQDHPCNFGPNLKEQIYLGIRLIKEVKVFIMKTSKHQGKNLKTLGDGQTSIPMD